MSAWSWLANLFARAAADDAMPAPGADILGAQTLPVSAVGDVLPTAGVLASLGWADPKGWSVALAPACARYGIITRLRLAAFLANVGHETNGGRVLVENLNYSVEGLLATFPSRITRIQASVLGRVPGVQPANQQGIANLVYGGEWGLRNLGNTGTGDGWRFRGRGLMQLTGRANYQRSADVARRPLDDGFLGALETQPGAAESAAHFWATAKCHAPADAGDISRVRRIVNGGQIGLAGVQDRYRAALAVLS